MTDTMQIVKQGTIRVSDDPRYFRAYYLYNLRIRSVRYNMIGEHDIVSQKDRSVKYGVLKVIRLSAFRYRLITLNTADETAFQTTVDLDEASGILKVKFNSRLEIKLERQHPTLMPEVTRAAGFEFTRDEIRKAAGAIYNELRAHCYDDPRPCVEEKIAKLCSDYGTWRSDRKMVLRRLGFIYNTAWIYEDLLLPWFRYSWSAPKPWLHSRMYMSAARSSGFCCHDKSLRRDPTVTWGIADDGSMMADVIVHDNVWVDHYRWNITEMRIVSCTSRMLEPFDREYTGIMEVREYVPT